MNFDSIIKDITKQYGVEGIAQIGVPLDLYGEPFILGVPWVDFMTHCNIPEGCVIEISGPESGGKTTMADLFAANFVRTQLRKIKERKEENQRLQEEYQEKLEVAKAKGNKKLPTPPVIEEYEPKCIMYVDAEGTKKPDWTKRATGYEMNDAVVQTIFIRPQGQSAEQIFDIMTPFLMTGKVGMVVFDSLTAIAPQQIINESMTKKDMAGLASVLKYFVTKYTGILNRFRTTFIGIMGTTQNLTGYGNPETTPGGTYWKRACSVRVRCKRGEFIDIKGDKVSTTAESPAGQVIDVALFKTKVCRWDRKLGHITLYYDTGVDTIKDTIDVAKRVGVVVEGGKQNWFNIINPETGEYIVDDEGNPVNVYTKGKFKTYLQENPKVFKQLYDLTYHEMSKDNLTTADTVDEALGVDIGKEFGIDWNSEEV